MEPDAAERWLLPNANANAPSSYAHGHHNDHGNTQERTHTQPSDKRSSLDSILYDQSDGEIESVYSAMRSPSIMSTRVLLRKRHDNNKPTASTSKPYPHDPIAKHDTFINRMKQRMHLDSARVTDLICIEEFKVNVRLALRVAVGVLIAGVAQTHAPTNDNGREWLFLPDHYYLGGLTYTALMVIYASAKTAGAVLAQVWQIDLGVALALLYNFVLFSCIELTQEDLIQVSLNLTGRTYYISLRDWGTVLPFVLLFIFVMLIAPVQPNVQKFAVSTNIYFALTIVSPMNPVYPTQLKDLNDKTFGTDNLMTNLAIYSVVGVVGTLIALGAMLLPTPIFAIKEIMRHMKDAPYDIREIMNLVVDAYCFRAKDISDMDFFRLRLERLLASSQRRQSQMEGLLDACWWEELVGIGIWFRFNKTVAKQFIKLHGRLLKDLHAMKLAIEAETGHWTHSFIMKKLQKSIYVLQAETNDLLDEVAEKTLQAATTISASKFTHLEVRLERLLSKYTRLYGELLGTEDIKTPEDVAKTLPLNLFLYSFHAITQTLFEFEQTFNHKNFKWHYRARNFLKLSCNSIYERGNYPLQLLLFSLRTTLGVLLGICCATFMFAFSSVTPTAVAMIAQNHIGGTYGNMANRMTGLLAGTVLPSIINYFLCKTSNVYLFNFLNNAVLFCSTAASMYLYFSNSYLRMAGMVAAYMSASVLLDQSCRSQSNTSGSSTVTTLSYSNLTQNTIGIVILVLVEALLHPESSTRLLRKNIRGVFTKYSEIFQQIFRHHLSGEEYGENQQHLSPTELKNIRRQLAITLPALLEEQTKLLHDATMEPTLWRPEFSTNKYTDVLESCKTLLTHLRILLDLVEWHEKRRHNGNDRTLQRSTMLGNGGANSCDSSPLTEEIVPPTITMSSGQVKNDNKSGALTSADRWNESQKDFEGSVAETLETLSTLFSEEFAYATSDDTAIFMQMKEAFRLADVNRTGVVDASALSVLMEKLLPYGAKGNVQLEQYVEEFMQLVDKNHDGKISFSEFMQALEDGFRLELEIYQTEAAARIASSREYSERMTHRQTPRISGQVATSHHGSVTSKDGESPAITLEEPPLITIKCVDGVKPPTKERMSDTHPISLPGSSRRSLLLEGSVVASDVLLNVESFTIKEAAATLKQRYCEHLLQPDARAYHITMEDFIVMSCLISTCEDIAATLTKLNTLAAS